MMDHKFTVKIHSNKDEIKKKFEGILLAAGGFTIRSQRERPDLLIFDLSEKYEEEFKFLQSISDSDAVGEVFVTSDKKDSDLLLSAMRIGIKEFITQPLNELEVSEALDLFKKRFKKSPSIASSHTGKVINVIGAKGGVGTTTVAVNLASVLAEKRKTETVAIMDLNTVFGEIPLFLSVKPKYHWGHIVKNLNRIDSTFLINAMTRHSSGVHVLPSPGYLNGHPPATAAIMEHLLGTMKKTFDLIIVDGGQSLDGPALKVIEMSDDVLLITLLSLPCLRNTNNLLKSLTNVGVMRADRIRLVINRFLKKSDITIKEAEDNVHREIFWQIPNDYRTTMSAINRGKPLREISTKAGITKNLASLADSLVVEEENKSEKKRWSIFKK
jgi:pilus assembly protein CpaE